MGKSSRVADLKRRLMLMNLPDDDEFDGFVMGKKALIVGS